jgi:formylglycine-generating enzyme required for sulfatase activity
MKNTIVTPYLAFVLLITSCAQLEKAAVGALTPYRAAMADAAVFQDCADCPKMVVIPSGSFVMGFDGGEADRPEGPPHAVTITRRFAIGKFEVTHAQYASFVRATGHESALGCNSWDVPTGTYFERKQASWRAPHAAGVVPANDHPVVCVSWLDAVAYTQWLSRITGARYRLPTEAQWEYVARAGSTTEFAWGVMPEDACRYANVYDRTTQLGSRTFKPADCDDGWTGPAPIGRYPANAFGLHDVIGNVWEWTQDCYVAPYLPQLTDDRAYEPQGPCELRAVRGGSWRTQLFRQRPSWRGRDPENRKSEIFGLRVARDL